MTKHIRILTYKILKSHNIHKILVLYVSFLLCIVLGYLVSVINTRFLRVEDYGRLKFILLFHTILPTLVGLGFSYSSSRLMTQIVSKEAQSRLVGATVVLCLVTSIMAVSIIAISSHFVDTVFNTDVGSNLWISAPLVSAFVFKPMVINLLQGQSRIYSLALYNVLPQLLFIVLSLFAITNGSFTLTWAIVLSLGSTALITGVYVVVLKPSFCGFCKSLGHVLKENRKNGFQIYLGAIASIATAQTIGIIIGYFNEITQVGYYSLAITITSPLMFIPSVIGTTLFRSFASQESISKHVLITTFVLSLASLVAFWLVIKSVLIYSYSERYIEVVVLAKILAVGMVFHGIGDLFNRFLGAHGQGKKLRNGAFATGAMIILCSMLTIPLFGAIGAALANTVSNMIYCLFMLFYYIQYIKLLHISYDGIADLVEDLRANLC